jgi:hypothetical protein
MKNYVERYIYAVTYYLPRKIRADVEKELDGLIAEMLNARCGGKEPTKEDIQTVLSELGTPEQLAAKYSGDDKNAFIGGMYYLVYKKVLRLVLPIVAICVFFGSALSVFLNEKLDELGVFIPKLIFSSVGGGLGGALQAFAIITVIFAIFERKKVIFNDGDILTTLTPIPQKKDRIKRSEPVGSIIGAIFAGVGILTFPQVIGLWSEQTGWVPAFDIAVIRPMWFLVGIWVIAEIVREIIRMIDGRYTGRVALVTIIANAIIGISSGVFLVNPRLMNPTFREAATNLFKMEHEDWLIRICTNLNYFILGIVILTLLWGAGYAVYRAFRSSQENGE